MAWSSRNGKETFEIKPARKNPHSLLSPLFEKSDNPNYGPHVRLSDETHARRLKRAGKLVATGCTSRPPPPCLPATHMRSTAPKSQRVCAWRIFPVRRVLFLHSPSKRYPCWVVFCWWHMLGGFLLVASLLNAPQETQPLSPLCVCVKQSNIQYARHQLLSPPAAPCRWCRETDLNHEPLVFIHSLSRPVLSRRTSSSPYILKTC